MPTMIQIRHVPDEVHRKLKVKAAQEGVSLSALLLREATKIAETSSIRELLLSEATSIPGALSIHEWFERADRLTPVETTREEIVEMIRTDRESH